VAIPQQKQRCRFHHRPPKDQYRIYSDSANAFILTGYDARQGHLRDITRTAFDNAWALQSRDGSDAGAWVWQNFGLAPWESKESQYHWAALMAVSVAQAPDHYRDDPKIAANLAPSRGLGRLCHSCDGAGARGDWRT
jgi:hypothetical protein